MSHDLILVILASAIALSHAPEPPSIEELFRCLHNCQESFEMCQKCLWWNKESRGKICLYLRSLCRDRCELSFQSPPWHTNVS
ncbi:hypothetical protein NP493_915g00038 [Ridgeia piscesae]|uniref:Uncharacterized protein n=1 Tax=Ridgeia piscesae TaxID=27915 RepID=A0AAD9NK39_RIDPI|nr:hypothetical protein NP493_915g00038 [Ridgeia piscesae]